MKKTLSLVLALMLILVSFGAIAESADEADAQPVVTTEETAEDAIEEETDRIYKEDYEALVNKEIPQELVVGSTTKMSGYFFTDMWGNNTADLDVRALIHGYSTVAWGRDGNFQIDEMVATNAVATDDAQGNRTYTFTLAEDLKYSDGTPITAKDYVFGTLLISSPVLTEFGGVPTTLQHLQGYDQFREGAPFSGVRLLGDYSFSLTISAENLPYFYELALVNVNPYPMAVIAPECDVLDDGEGAYIEGPFTADLMKQTVLDEDTGYLYFPKVTSGPYALESFDKETKTAVLTKNANFKGNYEGWTPFIEKLTYQYASPETMLDDLREGKLDLINKVSDADAISAAMDMQSESEAKLINYWRSGFSFLSFANELGATQSDSVRKAIAMCVNTSDLIESYIPQLGMQVHGYYGMGQWMAVENQEALAELALYEYNIDGANELLDKDGWVFNADGGEYNEANGDVRHRKNDAGELEELVIRWAKAKGSELSDLLDQMLTANLSAIGVRLETTELDFPELLAHYYRQTDRTYNMFNMATNFSMIFDPYYAFSTSDEFQGVFNTTGIKDEKLMQLADDLRHTEVGDEETYTQKWLALQTYWAEILPMKPLYSNIYADLYRSDLQNYAANAHFSWASAIIYSYLGEEEQVLPLTGTGESMVDLENREEAG